MRHLLYIAVIAILAFSCAKENNFGRAELEVSLLVAEYQGSVINPEGVTVYIRKVGEAGYLYEQKTDEDGKVVFSVLKEDEAYEVYSDYEKDAIPYSGTGELTLAEEENEALLRLEPKTDEFNLLSIKCVDGSQDGVPNVQLCLFLSESLADSANCDFSTYSQTTNNFGKANFWNLVPGSYYLGIRDTIGGYPVEIKEPFTIPDSGAQSEEVEILP